MNGLKTMKAGLVGLFALVSLAPVQAGGLYSLIPATDIIAFQGAAERLAAADRLRTLSQEIPSAACHLHGGIDVEGSRKLLDEAHHQFGTLLNALEFGDESVGIIGAETGRKQLADLKLLNDLWVGIDQAIMVLFDDPHATESLAHIKAQNMELYDKSDLLLTLMIEEYGNPTEMIMADAIMLDIAGRLAMLTQRIAKEACEIWSGNRSEERLAALTTSRQQFEVGVTALHDGMPQLGIVPAPTPEIRVALEEVIVDWAIVSDHLEAVIEDVATDEMKTDLYTRLNKKMYKMEDTIGLYVVHSRHQY